MPTGPTGPSGPPAYNIPWMWGNTWKRDHVNQAITEDSQVHYRYAPPSPQHPLGTDGGQSFAGDPPYKDYSDLARDPLGSDAPTGPTGSVSPWASGHLYLGAIMLNIWRVKTWKVDYTFAITGGINLFSHDYGVFPVPPELYTPFDIHFAATCIVGRQYREDYQDNPALPVTAPQLWNYNTVGPIADERHLFGTFKPQAMAFPGFPEVFFGTRDYPLRDQGHYYKISGPATAGLSVPRFGHTEDGRLGPQGADLNWNTKNTKTIPPPTGSTGPATTGPDARLEVMARYVAFGGDILQMPFAFADNRYYVDPMDGNQIVFAGINTHGQANPAHDIGPATMVVRVAVPASSGPTGPIPASESFTITRKCYLDISAQTNRGFYYNTPTGSLSCVAIEYFPFQTRTGLPVYNKDTGDQINDPFS